MSSTSHVAEPIQGTSAAPTLSKTPIHEPEGKAAARIGRSIMVIRKLRDDGLITFDDLKIPGNKNAPHYPVSRLDEIEPWFRTEDALSEHAGIAEPADDGCRIVLKRDGKVEDVGPEGKLYTVKALAKKRGTSEWTLMKEIEIARKEIAFQAMTQRKDRRPFKGIGREVYGDFDLLLTEGDEARLKRALKDRRERSTPLEEVDSKVWGNLTRASPATLEE